MIYGGKKKIITKVPIISPVKKFAYFLTFLKITTHNEPLL